MSLKTERPLPPAYPKKLETWGDHLRKRRLDLNLLQKEVARRLGVDQATVWNWERNRYPPRFRYLPKIIEFLGYVPQYSKTGTLAERLVTSRRLLGISQKVLARLLEVDQSTLAKWEQGRRKPKGVYLDRANGFLSRCASDGGGSGGPPC